jgi:glycosyltransferase involved in cell wall biosynthesis
MSENKSNKSKSIVEKVPIPHIALVMMVKNEKKRLRITLDSVKGIVNSLIIYDTGSTDNTIEILKEFSKESKIPLRLKTGEFVNFSESRNVSLEFADTFKDIDFLLLLDCNDELRGGEKLLRFAQEQLKTVNTGYITCQQWWSGAYDNFYNQRFMKVRCGWRYRGVVHEWLKDTTSDTDEPSFPIWKMNDDIVIYQDRTQDDDKSGKRFSRDYELLLLEFKNPNTSKSQIHRTIFYLAQTCSCLSNYEEAFYYYKLRSTYDGFWEEKFHSFLKCGDLSVLLEHPWVESLGWYMKSLEHTLRVEPLIKIAEHYKRKQQWFISYGYISLACLLNYPNQCILFVDQRSYEYIRWHILGIVGFFANQHTVGKEACLKALATGINVEEDKLILKNYTKDNIKIPPNLTKKDFYNLIMPALKTQKPGSNDRNLNKTALLKWKLYQKKNNK